MSRHSLLLRLSLHSDPQLMCVVRGALGPLTECLGFAPEVGRAIVLAVDEALTNVIRHAYLGRIDGPLAISFFRGHLLRDGKDEDSFEIRVADRGVPVKKEALVGRPLDELRPGGLGLHFIRESMDKVEFRHDKGTNYLRLVKVLGPAQPSQEI